MKSQRGTLICPLTFTTQKLLNGWYVERVLLHFFPGSFLIEKECMSTYNGNCLDGFCILVQVDRKIVSQDWKQKLEALQKKVEQEWKGLPVGLVKTCALCVWVYMWL